MCLSKKLKPLGFVIAVAAISIAANVGFDTIKMNLSTGVADVAVNGKYGQIKAGTIRTQGIAAPFVSPVTTHGTAGSSTWRYNVVAIQLDGQPTNANIYGQTTTGNATLTSSNYNTITWSAVTGAAYYDIYRVAHGTSPSTNGKIGRVSAPTTTFNDTGLAGDGTSVPNLNLTGAFKGANIEDESGAVFAALNDHILFYPNGAVALDLGGNGLFSIGGLFTLSTLIDAANQYVAFDLDNRELRAGDGTTRAINFSDPTFLYFFNGDFAINSDGSFTPAHISDASAANNTIYYSTTSNKVVYKDVGGTVHAFY